jgi:hypothetical protein
VSETGLVYTFTTPKLQPLVTKPEGKNLIQTCLNAPDIPSASAEPPSPVNTLSVSLERVFSFNFSYTHAHSIFIVDSSRDHQHLKQHHQHNIVNQLRRWIIQVTACTTMSVK